jgi:uncharacterized protein (TIGR00369 family)
MPLMSSVNDDYNRFARSFFGDQHPLFSTFGIEIVRVASGRAEMRMPFSLRLADKRSALHRGALVTLLDTTCGLAIFSALESLQPIATIDLRVDFLREIPPHAGLVADVECVGRTQRIAYVMGKAYAQDGDEPIALVAGSFAIDTMGPSFHPFTAERKSA